MARRIRDRIVVLDPFGIRAPAPIGEGAFDCKAPLFETIGHIVRNWGNSSTSDIRIKIKIVAWFEKWIGGAIFCQTMANKMKIRNSVGCRDIRIVFQIEGRIKDGMRVAPFKGTMQCKVEPRIFWLI